MMIVNRGGWEFGTWQPGVLAYLRVGKNFDVMLDLNDRPKPRPCFEVHKDERDFEIFFGPFRFIHSRLDPRPSKAAKLDIARRKQATKKRAASDRARRKTER